MLSATLRRFDPAQLVCHNLVCRTCPAVKKDGQEFSTAASKVRTFHYETLYHAIRGLFRLFAPGRFRNSGIDAISDEEFPGNELSTLGITDCDGESCQHGGL